MGLTTKRELAAIIVAHNALGQVIALADENIEATVGDMIIVDIYRKMDRIIRMYRGSNTLKDAAKIALKAYEKAGYEKPNATVFALTVLGNMLEKTGLKIFPVAKGNDLCDSFDAVLDHIDSGVSEAEEYADMVVREIMRQNPKHIKDEILEAS